MLTRHLALATTLVASIGATLAAAPAFAIQKSPAVAPARLAMVTAPVADIRTVGSAAAPDWLVIEPRSPRAGRQAPEPETVALSRVCTNSGFCCYWVMENHSPYCW